MKEMPPSSVGPPKSHYWQFNLRQMFAAITGIAILFGWAAWGGWAHGHVVVYLSVVLVAGILSRAVRRLLMGACLVVLVIWVTGVLRHLTEMHLGLYFGGGIDPIALCLSILLVLFSAVFLRAKSHITIWALAGSLIFVELFVAAAILDEGRLCFGGSRLFDVLGFNGTDQIAQIRAEWIRQLLVHHLLNQRWYIVAPWLVGIVVGEIIVRRRKPSGDEPQRV
jgi:hypothetical protein